MLYDQAVAQHTCHREADTRAFRKGTADASDALRALSEGQSTPLARYLADFAQAVEEVATYLARKCGPSSVTKAGDNSDIEWEGTLADFQDALAHEQHVRFT